MSQTFTRREFYDLVWSKPMIHLARDLGVSDVALHKICRKHHIPNPPLGWWAKKAAGKAVEQLPLPGTEIDGLDAIIIRHAPTADWKTEAIEMAEEKARSVSRTAASIPSGGSAIVRSTLAALRRGKANEKGLICVRQAGQVPFSIAKQSIGRVAELLPMLEAEAKIQGFSLTADAEPSRFTNGTQFVKFEITEGYRRTKHELTRKEKSEIAAWEKRTRSRDWRYVHGDSYPTLPDWDYSPTGQLTISFEPVWHYHQPTPRRSFNDGKRQRLEGLVEKIAIGIAVVAAAKAERKREDDERARRYEEQRERREHEARLKFVEGRRNEELAKLLDAQNRLEKLETLMARIDTEAGAGPNSRVQEFRKWLQGCILETRASLTPSCIEERFSEMNVFGSEDGWSFGSGRSRF